MFFFNAAWPESFDQNALSVMLFRRQIDAFALNHRFFRWLKDLGFVQKMLDITRRNYKCDHQDPLKILIGKSEDISLKFLSQTTLLPSHTPRAGRPQGVLSRCSGDIYGVRVWIGSSFIRSPASVWTSRNSVVNPDFASKVCLPTKGN